MVETLGTKESCSCKTCRYGCVHKPGWFLPGEAEKAAELMGLPLSDFFKQYLGVDWWEADTTLPEDIFVLAPAVVAANPGEEYSSNPHGTCVFYKDGLCSIHDAKPFECREAIHDMAESTMKRLHVDVAKAWVDHQDQLEELLGRKPVSESWSVYDLLELGEG